MLIPPTNDEADSKQVYRDALRSRGAISASLCHIAANAPDEALRAADYEAVGAALAPLARRPSPPRRAPPRRGRAPPGGVGAGPAGVGARCGAEPSFGGAVVRGAN